jgi:hypothetical protein
MLICNVVFDHITSHVLATSKSELLIFDSRLIVFWQAWIDVPFNKNAWIWSAKNESGNCCAFYYIALMLNNVFVTTVYAKDFILQNFLPTMLMCLQISVKIM